MEELHTVDGEQVLVNARNNQIVIQFKDGAQDALNAKGGICPNCGEPYAGHKCDTCG